MIYHRYLLRIIIIALLWMGGIPVSARTAADAMRDGDMAYKRKAYDNAIQYYEEAVGNDKNNALAYFKLGNAHYRLKQIGPAVLNYERALKRRPGFVEAANNLAIAQAGINDADNDQVFFIKWWHTAIKPAYSNTWAMISFLAFCVPLGVLTYAKYTRKRILWLRPQVIVAGIIVGIISAAMGLIAVTSGLGEDAAVVMRSDATMKLDSRSASKPEAVNLQEGSVVKVLHKTAQNWQVILEDGRIGQISSNYLSLVD